MILKHTFKLNINICITQIALLIPRYKVRTILYIPPKKSIDHGFSEKQSKYNCLKTSYQILYYLPKKMCKLLPKFVTSYL